jgi:hypothetical protein
MFHRSLLPPSGRDGRSSWNVGKYQTVSCYIPEHSRPNLVVLFFLDSPNKACSCERFLVGSDLPLHATVKVVLLLHRSDVLPTPLTALFL